MTEIKVIVDDEGHDVDAVFEEKIEVGGGGGIEKETDPTVPDWAKQEEKPEYKYEEIKEKPTLVEDISANIDGETFTLKLEDKDGNEIASTQVTLPKAEVPDLNDYVKNTDYATANQAGVMKTPVGFAMGANGYVYMVGANKTQIAGKSTRNLALVPAELDYAIKVGITTNTETWTDDEMQSARDLIGAVEKPDPITGLQSAITQTQNGGIESIALATWANQALFGRIPRYQNPAYETDKPASNMGMLVTNFPTKEYHCVNRGFVVNLPDKLTTLTDDEKAKWRGMIGATKLYLHTISVENSTEKLYIVSKNKSQYLSSTSFLSANKSDVISITDGKIDTIKIVFPKNGNRLHRVYLDEDLSIKTELSVFNTTWDDTVTEL